MAVNPLMAAQFASAIPQAALGTFQYLNAIKQARKNSRPVYGTYGIDTAQNNLDTLLNTFGLPQSALDLYYRNIAQNTNQGINAVLGAGGNANQIASLVGNQNQDFLNIAVQDTLQKKQDIGGILGARNELVNQRDKWWQLNEFDPWKDRAQAIAAEKNAGIQNITGSLNSLSGGLANFATSGLADSLGGSKMDLGTPKPTTPNSGVNTNAIIASLQTQPPQYNYLLPNAQNDNNVDYQSWFNSIMNRRMATANPSQYQSNLYTGY